MKKSTCKSLIFLSILSIISIILILGYLIHNHINKNNLESFDTDKSMFSDENAPENQYLTYFIMLHQSNCEKGKEVYEDIWVPLKEELSEDDYMINEVKVTMMVLDSKDDDDRKTAFKSIIYSDDINVTQYPTLVLFHEGKLCQYGGIMDKYSIKTFLKDSVYDGEFKCASPNYYNDETDSDCLPFLTEA